MDWAAEIDDASSSMDDDAAVDALQANLEHDAARGPCSGGAISRCSAFTESGTTDGGIQANKAPATPEIDYKGDWLAAWEPEIHQTEIDAPPQAQTEAQATPAAPVVDYKGDWLAAWEPETYLSETCSSMRDGDQAETGGDKSLANPTGPLIDYKGDWLAAWDPEYAQKGADDPQPTPGAAVFNQTKTLNWRPRLPTLRQSSAWTTRLPESQNLKERWRNPRPRPPRSGLRRF